MRRGRDEHEGAAIQIEHTDLRVPPAISGRGPFRDFYLCLLETYVAKI